MSNTDQLIKGVDLHSRKTSCSLCPVGRSGILYVYPRFWPRSIFKFINGQPLTKAKLNTKCMRYSSSLDLPRNEFARHIFRIRAATAIAQAGVEHSLICTMGRWNSSAYLLYIQTPPTKLAQFTKILAAWSMLYHAGMTVICLLQ